MYKNFNYIIQMFKEEPNHSIELPIFKME